MCHVTLNSAETSVVKSRPSVPYGAIFLFTCRNDKDVTLVMCSDRKRDTIKLKNDVWEGNIGPS